MHRRAWDPPRKIDYLVEELGEAVSVMRSINRALDPDNLLNPGKIVRI
jgi:D-lactate dehydrogenase (cytochrome)